MQFTNLLNKIEDDPGMNAVMSLPNAYKPQHTAQRAQHGKPPLGYTIPVDNFGSPEQDGNEVPKGAAQKNAKTEHGHGTESDIKGCTRCLPSSMFGTEGHFEPPDDDEVPYDLGGNSVISQSLKPLYGRFCDVKRLKRRRKNVVLTG